MGDSELQTNEDLYILQPVLISHRFILGRCLVNSGTTTRIASFGACSRDFFSTCILVEMTLYALYVVGRLSSTMLT